jgi:hypothetical protein
MGETGGHGRGLAGARPRADEEVAPVMGGGPSLLGGQSGQVEHAFEHTLPPVLPGGTGRKEGVQGGVAARRSAAEPDELRIPPGSSDTPKGVDDDWRKRE